MVSERNDDCSRFGFLIHEINSMFHDQCLVGIAHVNRIQNKASDLTISYG